MCTVVCGGQVRVESDGLATVELERLDAKTRGKDRTRCHTKVTQEWAGLAGSNNDCQQGKWDGRGKRKTAPQGTANDNEKEKAVLPEACRLHVYYMKAPYTRQHCCDYARYTDDGNAEGSVVILDGVVARADYAVQVNAMKVLETLWQS